MTETKIPATIDPNREDDGRFAAGNIANPTGANGLRRKGFAPWSVRVEQLEGKYPTVRALLQLFVIDEKNGSVKAADTMLDMNPIDAGILWGMFSQIYGDDRRLERESFWDRKEGRPKETVKHEGGIAHGLDPSILGILQNVRRAHAIGGGETTALADHSAGKPDSAGG